MASTNDKTLSFKDDKALLQDQEHNVIPEPVTAAPRAQRPRFNVVRLYGLFTIACIGFIMYRKFNGTPETGTPHVHKAHTQVRGPLSAQEAKELFLTVPDTVSALGASRLYATHPHLAGATEDYEDAKTILSLFQKEFSIVAPPEDPIFKAGSDLSRGSTLNASNLAAPAAWIDIYYPVMNTALDRSVDILDKDGNSVFSANLEEEGDIRDPEAEKYKDAVPAWHGLSKDGDVTGELVYVDYGRFEDYEALVQKGVNFTGKIALARYGGVFRGLKVKRAEELGAVGVLIYSDPRDDGHVTAENGYLAYPGGPARNPTAVQRGSVQYLSSYPGDPTTPGVPAYESANRTDGSNIPKIPSLPISWANAKRLLQEFSSDAESRQLNGDVSEKKVRLVNHVDTKVTPIWNTYAAIPGHIRDEVVVIGCHRDAWVMGAADPTSGTVSVHEMVRGLGHLLRNGWKPLRTILIASWDAEEYGLIGSTEWGEDFPEWIQKHVVAYLNVDVSVSGSRYNVGGSPSLAHLLRAAAEKVPHPTKANATLWDAREDAGPFTEGTSDVAFATTHEQQLKTEALQSELTGVRPLGSGSDYTVFLQRLGVASSDEGFGFTSTDAVYHYHSIYDSQHWQEMYADPGFHRHVAVAKHLGLTALGLVDSIILPLNTTQYAVELDSYLDRVEDLAKNAKLSSSPDFRKLRKSISKLQHSSLKLDEEKVHAEKGFLKALKELEKAQRKQHHACGHSRFVRSIRRTIKRIFGVGSSFGRLHRAGRVHAWYDRLFDRVLDAERGIEIEGEGNEALKKFIQAAMRVRKVNQQLIGFERGFIHEDGIKDREWYRHLAVAPGKWLGYGATTLPAITEAITYDQDADQAEKESEKLAHLLKKLAKAIQP